MNPSRRYFYNVPWRGVAAAAIVSLLMAYLAKVVAGATFVCVITLSAMFGVLALITLTRRLVFPRVLELADDAVLIPEGVIRTRVTRVPYADIIRMGQLDCGGHYALHIVTARGSFEIASLHLPNRESYRAVRDFICSQASIVMPRQDERGPSAWTEFPEPIVSWDEPEDWPRYRTRLVVSKPVAPRLTRAFGSFTGCFGLMILPWLLLRLGSVPTESAGCYFALCLPVALFHTWLRWWHATLPVHATRIQFRDHGITQDFGKQSVDLSYRDVSDWAVVERQFEGRVLHILLLSGRTVRAVAFALPDAGTRDRVIRLLEDKRIPHSPDLSPSWESRP